MKHLDLFSGIGGFALAAHWMGWETVQFVEIDKFCQKVLAKNFPNIPIHGDIKTFNGSEFRGSVDILTGGFPCQPFSDAGRRKGKNDARFLWPQMLRIIDEVRPRFIVGENVAGILTMENGKTLERILSDLEDLRFSTETFITPSCGVGAWHQRERVWIVAHDSSIRYNISQVRDSKTNSHENEAAQDYRNRNGIEHETMRVSNVLPEQESNTDWDCSRNDIWETEPDLGRVVYGVPEKLDSHRIKAIGNAIMPRSVLPIFQAIEAIYKVSEVPNPSLYPNGTI